MIACGEHSRTVHCAIRPRARLPTPPHSDDELKHEELPKHHSSHVFYNSSLSVTPVLLTPPGSAKTSIDLPSKSLQELLSDGGRSVLDRVKAFVEVKPAEPLVT